MGKSIFNISEEYLKVLHQLEELEGEFTPELEEALQISSEELERKVKAYCYYIKELDAEQTLIDDEIARLNQVKQTKENTIAKLKKILLDTVNIFGETDKSGNKTLNYDTLKLYTTNRTRYNIDENFDDEEYVKYSIKNKFHIDIINDIKSIIHIEEEDIVKVLPKKEITDAYKAGLISKGVSEESYQTLTIK